MEPDDQEVSGEERDASEAIARNRWFTLAVTDDGYAIWARSTDDARTPLAVFGGDDVGFADADERYRRWTRRMRLFAQLPIVLGWVVAIGVTLWFVSTTTNVIWTLGILGGSAGSTTLPPEWIRDVISLTYALWVGALAIMVMLWLVRRSYEDPPGV